MSNIKYRILSYGDVVQIGDEFESFYKDEDNEPYGYSWHVVKDGFYVNRKINKNSLCCSMRFRRKIISKRLRMG